jgi:hypothetical protein
MYYNQVPMLTHWRQPAFDLTGTWRGNDGSVYYIRHDDPHVWWAGFSDNGGGQTWTHVFHGIRMFNGTGSEVISGNWADVPRGTVRNTGTLVFTPSGDRLTKVTGGIITTTWQRLR